MTPFIPLEEETINLSESDRKVREAAGYIRDGFADKATDILSIATFYNYVQPKSVVLLIKPLIASGNIDTCFGTLDSYCEARSEYTAYMFDRTLWIYQDVRDSLSLATREKFISAFEARINRLIEGMQGGNFTDRTI